MQLRVLEPFRDPPRPLGGQVFEMALEAALDRLKKWNLTGRTLFQLEESSEHWMSFDTDGTGEFEIAFQQCRGSWYRVIGSRFNAEACSCLAKQFFGGDESQLHRYALDKREAATLSLDDAIQIADNALADRSLRRWWQFWK